MGASAAKGRGGSGKAAETLTADIDVILALCGASRFTRPAGSVTTADVMKTRNVSASTANKWLSDAHKAGTLDRVLGPVHGGGNGTMYYYFPKE